jgi:prophage DNA circulation protein
VSFDPSLPLPYKEDWREAYRYDNDDTPRLSTYQAPGGNPIPFVLDTTRLSGGQSVDTAEYPFFGLWSSTPLNEKPQALTIAGFIRGDTYIKNRNALVMALRVITTDDAPGYLDLPLWGRFPVVVVDFNIEEKGQENGQCAVSLTLTRAGVTTAERWKFEGTFEGRTALAAKTLEEAAVEQFEKKLEDGADPAALSTGFTKLKESLLGAVGRVQGAESQLNNMTNAAMGLANLLAQGVQSPKELAQALFSAAAGIVAGIFEIKNSVEETIAYFRTRDNIKNALIQFLSKNNYTLNIEAITARQNITKAASENLYRTMAYCAAGQILVQLDNATYQQTQEYWALYEQLEASLDKSDPAMYGAIESMRIATAQELANKDVSVELQKNIQKPVPLLYVAHFLACDDEKLRQLNPGIADSFVLKGNITYV